MGIFYQSLTQYLGFHNYGDEYKVMGLFLTVNLYLKKIKKMVNLKDKGLFELDLKYFTHQSQRKYEF